ncbi:MAG TPA: biopolymer transporter ExbD [Myxococcales bacterium]|jgi:biopolymer transport protein ExbD|nr:biopolymer transporter ExbD [Myxococcales bacterium]
MAGGMDLGTGGKGGKKPLDTQINLVPFIDLMAVTISFLIMTAVWTSIGRLQVANSGASAEPASPTEDKTPPISLLITEKELRLSAGTQTFDPIPVTRGPTNKIELEKLKDKFKELKTQLPDASTITLQAEDGIRYEDLVRIIDECKGDGLPNVSVAAAMG